MNRNDLGITGTARRICVGLMIAASLVLSAPAGAVVDRPLPTLADSLSTRMLPERQGGGMLWMIGTTLLEQGDVQGALPYLNDAWLMNPGVLEVGQTLRDVLVEMGYVADALKVSGTLLELPGRTADDTRNHIIILAANGQNERAFDLVHALQLEDPKDLDLKRLEGDLLIRQKRWEEAEAVFRDLRERDVDNAEINTGVLAELALMRDDADAARAEWRRGLREDPSSVKIRSSWIQFELARSRTDSAFAMALEGDRLGISPGDEHGGSWIVMTSGLLITSGRRDEAQGRLLALASTGDLGVQGTLLLTQLLAEDDQGARAIHVLRSAIEDHPREAAFHAYLSEHLSGAGDFVDAESHARMAMSIDPDDPLIVYSLISTVMQRHPQLMAGSRAAQLDSLHAEVMALTRTAEAIHAYPEPFHHMLLGATLATIGEPEAAVPHFEAAAEDPGTRRDALLNLSIALEDLDREEPLMEVLESLVEENPEDPTALNALGYSLSVRGVQLDRAEGMIRKALESEPENPAYLDSLGWVLFKKEQHLDAFDLLVRAANALPEDPEILGHLARVLQALDQPERARSVAARAVSAGGDAEELSDLLDEGVE